MEKVIVKRQISYSCIFPTGNANLENIIKTIPSRSAIEWSSYMFLRKSLMTVGETEHHYFFPLLFKLNTKLQHQIIDYLQKVDTNNYVFIDKVALLILTEYLISYHNDINEDVLESKDDFSNLMIAYLLCCDETLKFTSSIAEQIYNADSFVKLYLPQQLRYNDIYHPKDYRVEFIRFYYFMSFCESDDRFSSYLNLFLKENSIRKWDDYLYFVFETYLKALTNEEGSTNKIIIDPSSYYGKKYIDNMCVDKLNFRKSRDFTSLRDKPVYCQGNNAYSILSISFFLDKMFQSFLFDFASTLVKHKQDTKINCYPDLKKLVGEEFTESFLFYKIMNGCFGQAFKKVISGRELKITLGEGEPDFYLRKGRDIFIFEFKDVMLNANTKHCENYEQIQDELLQLFESSTFERNQNKIKKKPKDKGISQLLNVIENKLDEILEKTDKIECVEKLNVYPVIVYQDCCFDVEGINYILNGRLKKLHRERILSDRYLVKGVIMLSLESLIKLEDLFANGQLQLEKLINDYIIECSLSEDNKTLPFNKFLMRKALEIGYNRKMSKRFKRIFERIIEKNKPN